MSILPKRLRPLEPYFLRYKWSFVVGACSVLLMNGIALASPQVIQRAMDDLKPLLATARALSYGAIRQRLAYWVLLLIGVYLVKGIFSFITRWVVIGASREIEYDLRNDMFQHLEGLSYSFYQRTRTGDIMARATNDLNAVRMLLGPAIMYSANTIVFTIGALYFMWKWNPKLTLWEFAPLPIARIIIQYFAAQIHQRFERIQAMFSDITARVQENLSGVRVIRAYA